jgi:hypothetical protein
MRLPQRNMLWHIIPAPNFRRVTTFRDKKMCQFGRKGGPNITPSGIPVTLKELRFRYYCYSRTPVRPTVTNIHSEPKKGFKPTCAF